MSVLGMGTDVASVARFSGILDRFGRRFLERCFGEGERASILQQEAAAPVRAALYWAAKEATLKALGRRVRHIPYREVEVVVVPPHGSPELQLHGQAGHLARECGVRRIHLSLAHDGDLALAMVVLEGAG